MDIQFVRSIRSVSRIDITTLTPESAKSLAFFCRDLLRQSEEIRDASVKERMKSRIAEKLIAAHKHSMSNAS